MTISSRAALPARSPMPLIVHSTWRAPFCTAASELADGQTQIVVTMSGEIDVLLSQNRQLFQ